VKNTLAQLIVRNLEMEVKVRLKRRAELHGTSMEEEARKILRDVLREELPAAGGLGTEIVALFEGIDFENDIPELRGYDIRPVEFGS
jgi:plasmid stability protein